MRRIEEISEGQGMLTLMRYFPDGKANELNFVLFSTSGIAGHGLTIEDIEKELQDENRDEDEEVTISFVIVQPRIKCLVYGNAICTEHHIDFLKGLRASSYKAVSRIGIRESEAEND